MKLWRPGDPYIWLTGGALAFALLMVIALVSLVVWSGAGFFWPATLVQITTVSGDTIMGKVTAREMIPQPDAPIGTPDRFRIQIKRGNRDLYGTDFIWLDEDQISTIESPSTATAVERQEWGDFYGTFQRLEMEGAEPSKDWNLLLERLTRAHDVAEEIHAIERKKIGAINRQQEDLRLRMKKDSSPQLKDEYSALQTQYREQMTVLTELRGRVKDTVVLSAPGHENVRMPLQNIVRIYQPNSMSTAQKSGFYAAKVWEFISDEPRESNTEGGIWPAIFGTVMMVLLMSIFTTPLGVLAAVYLREYARQGPLVSAVRIAVNNLAGVPSIVFGVFGVGFFIYLVGGTIDQFFFADRLPTPTFGTGGILWASLTLSLMTLPVVIVATEEGLAAIPGGTREASLALGATKFETTWRVVLPAVTPAILTGLILAMARAAGEVAPLMITGVVKLAPALPLDGEWPFFHLDRKFMHLGFHIYDVGFQSPNVDAARPMVFTTTILLLLIVVALNLTAISIRAKLRKKYTATHL